MSLAQRTRLILELLNDRIVPTVFDLTSTGAQAVTPSGAILHQADPLDTGATHSFVRIQQGLLGSLLGGTEQGYNTNGRPLQYDENSDTSLTRALTLGEVPVVFANGLAYREFLLVINQNGLSPQLSLDEARIFTDTSDSLRGYDASTKLLSGRQARFDLDAGGDVSIRMDGRTSSGNTSPDVVLLVPDSAFNGVSLSSFIYLYSKFGGVAGASANGGFEQWSVHDVPNLPPPPPPPPPANASLSGTVYVDADRNGTREETESGQSGVTVYLNGYDSLGNTVSFQTVTADDGSFAFTAIPAGTYSLSEDVPFGYASEYAAAGNEGGDTQPGEVSNITMEEGDVATDYLFANVYSE